MKIEVERAAFIGALSILKPAISTRTTLPILTNVRIGTDKLNTLHLYGTNLDLSLTSSVPCIIETDGETTVPYRRLVALLGALTGKTVEIELGKKEVLKIKSGKSEMKLLGLPAEEYPPIAEMRGTPRRFVLQSDIFRRALSQVERFQSKDETRYVLNGVLFLPLKNDVLLVATDGRRLATRQFAAPGMEKGEGVIIRTRTVDTLLSWLPEDGADPVEIGVAIGENRVEFRDPEGLILQDILVEGTYPAWKQTIPPDGPTVLTVKTEAMKTALRRVETIQDSKRGVLITTREGGIDLTARNPEVGDIEEKLDAEITGPPVRIMLDTKFLLIACEDSGADILRICLTPGLPDPGKPDRASFEPAKFYSDADNFAAVVMCLRYE